MVNFTPLDNYQEFEPDIEDIWKQDILSDVNTTDKSKLNMLDAFKTTMTKQDKRFKVTKYKIPDPLENYKVCNGRLKSLHKRLAEKPEKLKRFDEIIKDQLQKGIIKKATLVAERRVHYILHQAVISLDKHSTKVRIVCDASVKLIRGKKLILKNSQAYR